MKLFSILCLFLTVISAVGATSQLSETGQSFSLTELLVIVLITFPFGLVLLLPLLLPLIFFVLAIVFARKV